MKIVRPATETEVLSSFAESEFTSERHRHEVADFIPSYTAKIRILETHPSKWTSLDRKDAVAAIRKYRAVILDGILKSKPSWHLSEIRPDELSSLRPVDFYPFNALAKDRRLGTLVEAMDSGRVTPGDGFSLGYKGLRRSFDPEKVIGLPGVAANAETGPFVVFDGLTRLCVLHSRFVSGDPIPLTIPLYLALSPKLSKGDWNWM